MDLTFGNAAGLWALLGIPAVLAIHFLQRKSVVATVTTLFLLDQMQRESETGNRFERLRSSLPLWLQLLAVLVLTWLLVEPRWTRPDSVLPVAVVLDSSASMAVSRPEATAALGDALANLGGTAARTEYLAFESRSTSRRLYNGPSSSELITALDGWQPRFGTHDPTPALRLARTLVGSDGLVVYLTDHPPAQPLPFGTLALSEGSAVANVGFAGLTVDAQSGQPLWRALVRNYSDDPQSREWWLEAGDQASARQRVSLDPGQTVTLQGPFLDGAARTVLRMEPDEFATDDTLPMVPPKPKPLDVALAAGFPDPAPYRRLLGAIDGLALVTDSTAADLVVTSYDALDPKLPDQSALVFLRDRRAGTSFSGAPVLADNHPLTEGLNWQALVAPESLPLPNNPTDDILVWQGDKPLVFLRSTAAARFLCFNFALEKSNADKLPALVVLVHRFLEAERRRKVGEVSANFETGQLLTFAFDPSPDAPPITFHTRTPDGEPTARTVPPPEATALEAPPLPTFFDILQGPQRLVHGAAHFADTREADFRDAGPADEVTGAAANTVERTTERDALWRLWLLVLLALAVASWWSVGRPAPQPNVSLAKGS